MTDIEYSHIQRWTLPQSYVGETWDDYYSAGVGQSRDSDPMERANFEAMLRLLKTAPAMETPDGEPTVTIVRENHWAVGWVEWIAIHETDSAALKIADDAKDRLEDYPIMNDDLFSEYESDDCAETWANCYNPRERLKYLREHCADLVKSAGYWRDILPHRMILKAVRGDWWAAGNILPSPSDLIY